MRVGSLHYATNSGLGVLAKEFYDNGVITDVLIKKHVSFETHVEWYPDSDIIGDQELSSATQDMETLEGFIKKLDILFVFESPWYKETLYFAQKHNIPVACMPMYEWSPYPMYADIFITPSLLDFDYYRTLYPNHSVVMLPVPANSNVQWRFRERATTFMHNGGNGSRNDRNGTQALIEALPYIDSPIKLKIRAQNLPLPFLNDPRVEVINKQLPFSELWQDADVFIFVERFNGLCLPLQEAFSNGTMIIAGNRYPMNTWLPVSPLVNPIGYEDLSFVNVPFKSAIYDARDIARKIDEFYGTDISSFSLAGKKWAEENCWEKLKPQYISHLMSILR